MLKCGMDRPETSHRDNSSEGEISKESCSVTFEARFEVQSIEA